MRTISIIGEPLRGFNANQLASELKQEVSKLPLDSSLDWEIGGMAEKDAETLPQVTSGVMIAALIIFFILLFHFKRISLALVNLSSMSLCIFGAAIGLLVTGFDVSLTCILGVVSLMGILVRNGIIMLDYAEELRRDKGLSVREAAFQLASAACALSSLHRQPLGRRTSYDDREQYTVVANGSRYLLRYAYLDGTHRHHPACALLARVRQAREV